MHREGARHTKGAVWGADSRHESVRHSTDGRTVSGLSGFVGESRSLAILGSRSCHYAANIKTCALHESVSQMNVNNARYRTQSDKTRYTLIVRPCSRGTGHKREMRGLDIRYDLHRHLGVVKYPGMHATLIAWGFACRVARMQRTRIHRNPGMLPPAIRETNKSTDHHLSSNLDIIIGAWVRSGTRCDHDR